MLSFCGFLLDGYLIFIENQINVKLLLSIFALWICPLYIAYAKVLLAYVDTILGKEYMKKERDGMEENIIYHYCSVETFINIIRNHTLRLSDLCSTTDNMD